MAQVTSAQLRPILALMAAIVCVITAMVRQAEACTPDLGVQINLYESFEVQVANTLPVKNPFDYEEIALEALIYTPDGRELQYSGFYDGVTGKARINTWKLRILADRPGIWRYHYRWSGGPLAGSGCFQVDSKKLPNAHGPVSVDREHPRYLIYDDGTPHYWWGGKWLGARSYGPVEKDGQRNPYWHSDTETLDYLDLLKRYDHNGILVDTALAPLKNDKLSWDLPWIRRGEWLVKEAARRGIYVQLNFFNTWARDRDLWFQANTDGAKQVFNVWRDEELPAIKNYIRSLVARFSGYANVYWELGNEMEHRPNSGNAFAALAERYYIPWIRQYDPHSRPIALSEEVWRCTSADIGLLHQTYDRPISERESIFTRIRRKVRELGKRLMRDCWPLGAQQRPVIMNEMVGGGDTGPLWEDYVIRDPASRYSYRRAFWQHFTSGGSGTSESTGLDIRQPPNGAVLNVMADQQRFRAFLSVLSVNINEMDPLQDWITQGPPETVFSPTRRKEGEVYVTYFRGAGHRPAGRVTLSHLPPGSFEVKWIEPSSNRLKVPATVISGNDAIVLDHPPFVDDMVLLVTTYPTKP